MEWDGLEDQLLLSDWGDGEEASAFAETVERGRPSSAHTDKNRWKWEKQFWKDKKKKFKLGQNEF